MCNAWHPNPVWGGRKAAERRQRREAQFGDNVHAEQVFRHLVDLQQIVRLFLVSWALVRVWFPRVMQGEAPLTVTLCGIRVERDRFSVAD